MIAENFDEIKSSLKSILLESLTDPDKLQGNNLDQIPTKEMIVAAINLLDKIDFSKYPEANLYSYALWYLKGGEILLYFVMGDDVVVSYEVKTDLKIEETVSSYDSILYSSIN
jgi:hypothetical protein